jgi:hypothetical protein
MPAAVSPGYDDDPAAVFAMAFHNPIRSNVLNTRMMIR